MKKIITYILCAATAGAVISCKDLSQVKESHIVSVTTIVRAVSADDLGRVMVFTENSSREEKVFIRNFYNSTSNDNISVEIKRYITSLEPLIGTEALVHYYENGIGDAIIIKIE